VKAALRRIAIALAIIFGAALQAAAMAEVGAGALLDQLAAAAAP
jgi:hypothetical protein